METSNANKKRLTIVGPFPPPVGGNSVHVKRLRDLLGDEFEVRVLDPYGASDLPDQGNVVRFGPPGIIAGCRLAQALFGSNPELVHIHISAMNRFLLIAPLLLLTTTRSRVRVVSIHSGTFSQSLSASPTYRQFFAKLVLDRFDRIVTVNHEQRNLLERFLRPGVSKKIETIPAFIPEHRAKPSARVRELVNKLPSRKHTVITSGSVDPIYGLESVAQACGPLPSVRLIVCVYGRYSESYNLELKAVCRKFDNITVVEGFGEEEFNQLLELSDAFVRATDRDGDSIAVREALGKGLAVVASDAAQRPPGTVLYRYGDNEHLRQVLLGALSSHTDASEHDDIGTIRAKLRRTYVRLYECS